MPLPLVIAANAAVGKPWARVASWTFGAFAATVIALFGVLDLVGAPVLASDLSPATRFAVDAGTTVTAFAAAGFLFRPIRKEMSAFLPIDPDSPVHSLALVLATLLLGTQVTTLAFTDTLATSQAQPPLALWDLVLDETPFLILGAAGVGIFMRRRIAAAATRLGLVVPAWWHIALALAAAGAFFAFGQQMNTLGRTLTPGVADRVNATTQHVFGQLGGPVGIVALAVLPGICEEVLFRGALQPRIGLVATAVLFTSIHTEYGLSLDTLSVLVIALGLGLIRRYTNTTASATCHVTYNLLVAIGFTGAILNVAIGVEVALVAATAYAVWTRRRAAPFAP